MTTAQPHIFLGSYNDTKGPKKVAMGISTT
jgi:hypothetical protein